MGDKVVSDQEFCLRSEFLTDVILMDKENMYNDRINSLLPRTHVPTESHTESLSYFSNNNYLVPPFSAVPKIPEKTWPMASSTQSVLSPVVGNGGSLGPSPPITPIGRNTDHHQVRNMSLQGQSSQGQNRNFTPVNPSNALPSVHNGTIWGHQQAGGQFGNGGYQYDVTPEMARRGPQVQAQRPSYGGVEGRAVGYGGGIARQRGGTGVFLPRRYNPGSRKRTGGSTTQPAARVAESQGHLIGSDHSSEMTGTSTSNLATSSAERVNDEIRLPQEWTY
ncbi:hypothetical protein POM88_048511 [Heracleum sosnowskyi]|uniref:Uncharacterized protein n=1 Tax=Heracleum sosnowskyi TaxID=360622 RepID=A0AAD8GWD8_9APIA|nr:hypothetical protein POM88_048511 [Heracleum sosnowskyi]